MSTDTNPFPSPKPPMVQCDRCGRPLSPSARRCRSCDTVSIR